MGVQWQGGGAKAHFTCFERPATQPVRVQRGA